MMNRLEEYRREKLRRAFRDLGMSEGGARIAAAGRNGIPAEPMNPDDFRAVDRALDPNQWRNETSFNADGEPAKVEPKPKPILKSLAAELEDAFVELGMSESAAKIAAKGR